MDPLLRCIEDSTTELVVENKDGTALDPKTKRLNFQAFNFLNSESAVYIHAVLKVCVKDDDRYDYNFNL